MPSLPSLASLQDLLPASEGRRRRRSWVGDGRAHIEVRAASRPGSEDGNRRIKEALERVEGVDWAEVNGVVGRAIIAFDGDSVDIEDLLDVVDEVEEDIGVGSERFSHDRPELPGDGEAITTATIGLVADAAGIGLSIAGSFIRRLPLPTEVGAIVSFADSQPRVRRAVVDVLGPTRAEITLTIVNSASQAISAGPLGLVVDAGHRLNLLAAARARAALWEKREAELVSSAEKANHPPVEVPPRPVPIPDGPVETYLERAGVAGLLGGAITTVTTRSVRRGAAAMLASTGKPARLGRESYTAWVELALARRGVLVNDQAAMRRLDRVDCLVLTDDVVVTGRWQVGDVVVLDEVDHDDPHRRLRSMFDAEDPHRVVRRGKWRLGPLDEVDPKRGKRLKRALRRLDTDRPFVLSRDGRPMLVGAVVPQLAPAARSIIEVAHDNDLAVVIAGSDPDLTERLHADVHVDRPAGLAAALAGLQADGRVVALVSRGDHAALKAADVAIGLHLDDEPPWGADVVVTALDDVWLLVQSCGAARRISDQSNALALSGSSVGALLALTSPVSVAASRASTAVNVAAVASMTNGARRAVQLYRRPMPSFAVRPRWHELPRNDVLERLDSTTDGLSTQEARSRHTGVEKEAPAPVRLAQAVVAELANPLTPVLAGSAVLSATVGSAADAVIVMSVMGLNGVLSGAQRFAAEQSIRKLLQAGSVTAHVRRDGEVKEVPAALLVPGDVVVLEAGDTVPADCRVLHAHSLLVDESSLTGEPEPVHKRVAASFAVVLAERSSMVYAGTAVVTGSATAVVVEVGSATEAGSPGARDHDHQRSAIGVEARLRQLSAMTLPVAAGSGIIVAAGQMLRGLPVQSSLASGVSLAVAAVPEGLPMLATVAQLSAARRLSRRNVLVRNPRAIEALGRVDVLCVDKTGTLTEGRVAVTVVSDGRRERSVDVLRPRDRRLLVTAALASPRRENGRGFAHVTDGAVRDAAEQAINGQAEQLVRGILVAELPFGEHRAFHARWEDHDGEVVLSVKGAPEVVLDACRAWRRGKHRVVLTEELRAEIEAHVHALARRGLRVLAVANRYYGEEVPPPADPGDADIEGLELLGFVGLADPVRSSAPAAIAGLRTAGVATVMVTGDHPVTAEGIAAELGLLGDGCVITGPELERMSDPQLDAALETVSVFARVSPADKVRIVSAFQRAGRFVAMTGDGANDARAIRKADVGVAVGERSTPTARAAADVIITDDRIETIVEAIIEGRALWSSVRDALAILLGGNLGEIGFILLSGGLGGQPSLSTRQVLLVNLFTDVVPSLAIASRPPPGRTAEELALEGPDQSLGDQLDRAILQRAVATTAGATLAWGIARATGRPQRASTIGLGAVVGTQLGQTITAGHFDPVVAAAALGSAAVMAAIIQTPGVSQFFGCTPLGPGGWAIVVGSSAAATLGAAKIPHHVEGAVGWVNNIQGRLPISIPALGPGPAVDAPTDAVDPAAAPATA